jgi:hypothetical protein
MKGVRLRPEINRIESVQNNFTFDQFLYKNLFGIIASAGTISVQPLFKKCHNG